MSDLLLVGHGSRDPAAADEFALLLKLVAEQFGAADRVGGGFLELADPPIDEALDDLVAAGADDVVAVPYVLFGAGHLKDDGPAILGRARSSATSRTGPGPASPRSMPGRPRGGPSSSSAAARPTPTPAPTT